MVEGFQFEKTIYGLDKVRLTHIHGTYLEVYLFGATITRFRTSENKEILFLSKKAVLNGTKPIRGGIPIVFPQFGAGTLPNHGFARTSLWKIKECTISNDNYRSLILVLEMDMIEVIKNYPQYKDYNLLYTIELLDRSFKTTLTISSKYTKLEKTIPDLKFNALLHTYYKVQNSKINEVQIKSKFNKSNYFDKVLSKNDIEKNNNNIIKIEKEMDRIYFDSSQEFEIDLGDNVSIELYKDSWIKEGKTKRFIHNDIVIWNPWIEKSKSLTDMEDKEYQQMVCVEPGNINEEIVLKQGETYYLYQKIMVNKSCK